MELTFYGLADASAVVFLDAKHFVVADDESNVLRTYSIDKPKGPVSTRNLNKFLDIDPSSPESDIEAAARVGDRIYWISSHGRNKSGKIRASRYRFFCTKISLAKHGKKTSAPGLIPVGRPCKTLIHQLIKHPCRAGRLLISTNQLNASLPKKERKKLAPKKQGLNIEGLMYYKPNKSLLIGLRNPLLKSSDQNNNAIVIELLNPSEIIDKNSPAKFGNIFSWDLNNRGIRAMQYDIEQDTYYLVAGPIDSETNFALYQWDGQFKTQPVQRHKWPQSYRQFKPEAIAGPAVSNDLWFFSDDGTLEIPVNSPSECKENELLKNNMCPNKYLLDNARKSYRVQIITPDDFIVER